MCTKNGRYCENEMKKKSGGGPGEVRMNVYKENIVKMKKKIGGGGPVWG